MDAGIGAAGHGLASGLPQNPPMLSGGFGIVPTGDSGFLVSLEDPRDVHPAASRLVAGRLAGVRDVVPAARTVLVVLEAGAVLDESLLRAALAREAPEETRPSKLVEIAVRYDGADLQDVAARAGLTSEDVVRRHAAAEYEVAFVGFRPGFPYLRGLPRELRTPRRSTPRPRVPAGSVAIGAEWSGVYPAATPGGWNLIGTTDAVIFDAARRPPGLFAAGDRVRFVRV